MTIAWLFPGQGSQAVGMAKDVIATSAAARAVFERADAALAHLPAAPKPLSRLILEGPEDELTLTANAQPALVATSSALLAALRERVADLPAPAFTAGHSLGEYSALVASEAISLDDAVRLVHIRGRAMQDAVAPGVGAMSAVMGIAPDRLVSLCGEAAQGEVIAPANFNAPGQIVVAGHAGAVARLGALASAEKGARVIPLKVSAPFHCALMAPAARAMASELERVRIAAPRVPVVANVDAAPNSDPARVGALLIRQIDGAVRWEETVRLLAARGVTHALEIGPGKVLAGLAKRIAKEVKVLSVGDSASLDAVAPFLAGALAS
jgi:[acyl-carrier-protein] S-malonyltransferase